MTTAPTVIHRLCEDAVRIRKEAAKNHERTMHQLLLLGQLSGIRIALACLHGWDDAGPQGPAAELIFEWWKRNAPEEWEDGTAYTNVLIFELNELLAHHPKYRTIKQLIDHLCAPSSTTYRVFSYPHQTSWETLAVHVKALGGNLPHFKKLWMRSDPRWRT